MLVARIDELGKLASARTDATSQLVAGDLPRGLPPLGHRAGPESARVLDDVSNGAGGFERVDGIGLGRKLQSTSFKLQGSPKHQLSNEITSDLARSRVPVRFVFQRACSTPQRHQLLSHNALEQSA